MLPVKKALFRPTDTAFSVYCMFTVFDISDIMTHPYTCGGSFSLDYNQTKITIRHPGKGFSKYADDELCVWEISAAPELYIQLNFTNFDTEEDYDYVSLKTFNGSTLLKKYFRVSLCTV